MKAMIGQVKNLLNNISPKLIETVEKYLVRVNRMLGNMLLIQFYITLDISDCDIILNS